MSERTVLVTGVAGNLGRRLLPMLSNYKVLGVDIKPPQVPGLARFEAMDLGEEPSCRALMDLIRETLPDSVVHLAFITDPVASGVLERERAWQIDVDGTARVAEAVAGANRLEAQVRRFIYSSAAIVYGSETPGPVDEDFALGGHSLLYAHHKKECESVVRMRAESLGDCNTYILRPQTYCGASMQNYLMDALRGTAFGSGWLGRRLRRRGKRFPFLLPAGRKFPGNLVQFTHVDDVARVIHSLLQRPYQQDQEVQTFNIAGNGPALSIAECAHIANAGMLRLPTRFLCQRVLEFLWRTRTATIPPDAFPYMVGSCTVRTDRLRNFLGEEYDRVIQYTVEQALRDCFQNASAAPAPRDESSAEDVSR